MAEGWRARAALLLELGNHEAALADLEKLIDIDSEPADAVRVFLIRTVIFISRSRLILCHSS
jgi:hypothetical protein